MIAEILSNFTGISIVTSGMGNSHSRASAPCDFLPPVPLRFLLLSSSIEERWAAAQTRLRDFIPQTPFTASRRFKAT